MTELRTQRETRTFPIIQRGPLIFFRRMSRATLGFFGGFGQRVLFLRDLRRAFGEPETYGPLIVRQMRLIGVDSVPLVIMVAAFIGAVIAIQVRYQLFPGIQLSIVGLSSRQITILETGPLLTGLVLAGRIGAKMTAEIGTMRVTEQIDALRTLATHPVDYLVVPRLLATTIALPLLTVESIVLGICAGYWVGSSLLGIDATYLWANMLKYTGTVDVFFGLTKAFVYGGIIALVGCYKGLNCHLGAEGVGRATTEAVVYSSIAILITNFFLTLVLQRIAVLLL